MRSLAIHFLEGTYAQRHRFAELWSSEENIEGQVERLEQGRTMPANKY